MKTNEKTYKSMTTDENPWISKKMNIEANLWIEIKENYRKSMKTSQIYENPRNSMKIYENQKICHTASLEVQENLGKSMQNNAAQWTSWKSEKIDETHEQLYKMIKINESIWKKRTNLGNSMRIQEYQNKPMKAND